MCLARSAGTSANAETNRTPLQLQFISSLFPILLTRLQLNGLPSAGYKGKTYSALPPLQAQGSHCYNRNSGRDNIPPLLYVQTGPAPGNTEAAPAYRIRRPGAAGKHAMQLA